MTRIARLKKAGWRVQRLLVTEAFEDYEVGEDLGFWRLVNPDGSITKGWDCPSHVGYDENDAPIFEPGYRFNCFESTDEAFEFAERS